MNGYAADVSRRMLGGVTRSNERLSLALIKAAAYTRRCIVSKSSGTYGLNAEIAVRQTNRSPTATLDAA